MSRKAILLWFFVYFVALACLSTAYLIDEEKISSQEAEISRIDNVLEQLAINVYNPELYNQKYLPEGNYCMELPISSQAAIVWKTGQDIKGRHYILLKTSSSNSFLRYWEKDKIRTLPWPEEYLK